MPKRCISSSSSDRAAESDEEEPSSDGGFGSVPCHLCGVVDPAATDDLVCDGELCVLPSGDSVDDARVLCRNCAVQRGWTREVLADETPFICPRCEEAHRQAKRRRLQKASQSAAPSPARSADLQGRALDPRTGATAATAAAAQPCVARKQTQAAPSASPSLEKQLLEAAKLGRLKDVEQLLSQGAKALCYNLHASTPLHLACAGGHGAVVKLLLRRKQAPDLALADSDGRTVLHLACAGGHGAVVLDLLASAASHSAADRRGCTPLHAACARRDAQPELVDNLLSAGADTRAVDKEGVTVLHAAVLACAPTSVLKLLLAGGADPFAKCLSGDSALHAALQYGEGANRADLQARLASVCEGAQAWHERVVGESRRSMCSTCSTLRKELAVCDKKRVAALDAASAAQSATQQLLKGAEARSEALMRSFDAEKQRLMRSFDAEKQRLVQSHQDATASLQATVQRLQSQNKIIPPRSHAVLHSGQVGVSAPGAPAAVLEADFWARVRAQVLEVKHATKEQRKERRRDLSLKFHPDKAPVEGLRVLYSSLQSFINQELAEPPVPQVQSP